MSAGDDLDKFFSALQRHKDLIIQTHLDNQGFVDERVDNDKAVAELIRLGVFWRMDDDAARARLSQSFSDVLNLARRDELRRQVNLDIGERLSNLEQLIETYRKARRFGSVDEQDHVFRGIEEQVYGLREALSGASRQLWMEIDSEFAYVTSLELKLQENQRVIDKVKRLNANLGLLDYETLSGERFAGADPRLRRLFTGAFVQQIARVREELVDALHRLDAMLFAFRTQQRQGRIVHAFALKYQREPGFTPLNHAAQTQIPPILNQIEAIPLGGHTDLDSGKDEILLTQWIQHLRKQPQRGGAETESKRISVRDTEGVAEEQVELDTLNRAVQDFYLHAAEQGAVQAMANFDLAPEDCPADIWLFAIASRHNMMSPEEHAFFTLEFIDKPDPFFTGQRSVSDIGCTCAEAMEIGKQVYKSVQRVLQQCLAQVVINKIWLQIHSEFAIGKRVGKNLALTPDDRERLRSTVHRATGLDPLHDSLDGDRLAMSLRSTNEKLSSQPVFGKEIKLFRMRQPISLVGGAASTPPGSYLTTNPDQLDTARLDAIVIIENGVAFLNWPNVRAEPSIRHALALYRGHDDSVRQMLNLLNRVRGKVRIYAAVDFDPAGFRIALSLGADALLVPEHYPRILRDAHLNKPAAFEKQNTKADGANIPAGWRIAWDWIHQHRVAVTQEALLVRNWNMVALPAADTETEVVN